MSDRTLVLPGIGSLELADTVYVARDREQTLGFVFADDETGASCVVALDLEDDGCGSWRARVRRVLSSCDGASLGLDEALGSTFCFTTETPPTSTSDRHAARIVKLPTDIGRDFLLSR